LTVTRYDGRQASTSQTMSVRTHDVAIAKFAAPPEAKAGHTRSIKVTFKAVAYIVDTRDTLPGDNEAIAPPTKLGR
jgi:hypothetical protein